MKLQRILMLTLICLFTVGIGIVGATEAEVSPQPAASVEMEQDHQPPSTINGTEPKKVYPSPVRDIMATTGEIVAVDGNRVTIKGDGNYPIVIVNVTDKTLLLDGNDGDIKGQHALRKGRKVTAYYSSKMARSYPPQSQAFAIVFGKKTDKQGKFMRVEKVMPLEQDESVRLLNSNRDIIVTVDKDVYPDYQEIKEGDCIMAWYNIMTLSLPGQTKATKVVVFQ